MTATNETAEQQTIDWGGVAGRNWVEAQGVLDRMLKPIEDALVDAVAWTGARRVLDVGCGTGGVTRAVARRLGPDARVVGIDVAAPMIAAARDATEDDGVEFVLADAETHAFEPDGFDLIASRFGVMFFDDEVRAFANLRRACVPGGGLRMAAWRSAAENPFMTAAERAAAPHLDLPDRANEPRGQFGFADADRVRGVLAAAGWRDVDFRPLDLPCAVDRAEIDRRAALLGPVGRALADADEATRDKVVEAVRRAYDVFTDGDQVRFDAACWMIAAEA